MSVIAIRTKLLTKLNEMQSLRAAWDWEISNTDGKYPYATLTLRDGEANFASTAHNLRRRGFSIKLYQERQKDVGQTPEQAEDIMTAVIDELETALDMDTTLSGVCKWVRPVGWRADYVVKDTSIRLLEIDVDAFDIISST